MFKCKTTGLLLGCLYVAATHAQVQTQGAGAAARNSETSTLGATGTAGTSDDYSKLSKKQLKAGDKHRLYFSFDRANAEDKTPVYPNHITTDYTYIGYEYYLTPEFTYGIDATFQHQYYRYLNNAFNQSVSVNGLKAQMNDFGAEPYFTYLFSPAWLLEVSAGYYYRNYVRVYNGGSTAEQQQSDRFVGGANVTWIGPKQVYTASIRAGLYYSAQDFRRSIDSDRAVFPQFHSDTSSVTLSTRLKYYPHHSPWNAFLEIGGGYLPTMTNLNSQGVYRSTSGKRRWSLSIGPGVHWDINPTWQLRFVYMNNQYDGYIHENEFKIRLRWVGNLL